MLPMSCTYLLGNAEHLDSHGSIVRPGLGVEGCHVTVPQAAMIAAACREGSDKCRVGYGGPPLASPHLPVTTLVLYCCLCLLAL